MKLWCVMGLVACASAFGCDEGGTTTVGPTSVPPADHAAAPTPAGGDMAVAVGADMARAAAPQTVMVAVGPNNTIGFVPATVTIHPGDTVMWTWSSNAIPHSVTSGTPGAPDGMFDSG